MISVQVIYENGVLRPLRPLNVAEGTRFEVVITESVAHDAHVDEAEYREFLSALESISSLPLQSAPQPNTARDHDQILYPKEGATP